MTFGFNYDICFAPTSIKPVVEENKNEEVYNTANTTLDPFLSNEVINNTPIKEEVEATEEEVLDSVALAYFSVNLSKESYSSKEEAKTSLTREGAKSVGKKKMSFTETTFMSLDKLEKSLIQGHSYCSIFDTPSHTFKEEKRGLKSVYYVDSPIFYKDGSLKLSAKRDDTFLGSHIITIDVDETLCKSVEEFIKKLSIQPSLVYESYSSNKPKIRKESFGGVYNPFETIACPRFHILYIFDKLLNKEEFKSTSTILANLIEKETGEIIDNCSLNISQYFNGTFGGKSWNFNKIYLYNEKKLNKLKGKDKYIKPICEIKVDLNHTSIFEKETDIIVKSEIKPGTVEDKLLSYIGRYEAGKVSSYFNSHFNLTYFYNTLWDKKWAEDEKGYFVDSSYLETLYAAKKKGDGSKRRKFIFTNMLLRKLIKPEVTIAELIYTAFVDVELQKFVDNSDNVFNADFYKRNALKVYDLSTSVIEKQLSGVIKTIKDKAKGKLIVNPNLREEVKNCPAKAKSLKAELENSNIKVAIEKGLMTAEESGKSVRTLKRAGINTKGLYKGKANSKSEEKKALIKSLINPSLSVRENLSIVKGMGIKVSDKTIQKIMKEL